jgi:hypothetical protein
VTRLSHTKAVAVERRQREPIAAVEPLGSRDQAAVAGGDREGRKPGVVRAKATQKRPPFLWAGAVVDERLGGSRVELRRFAARGERQRGLAEVPSAADPVGESDDPEAGRRVGAHVGDVAEHVARVSEPVVVDLQAVAVALAFVLVRGLGRLHRGEARRRKELPSGPELAQVGGQILRGAAQATVGLGGLDPGGRRQPVLGVPGRSS